VLYEIRQGSTSNRGEIDRQVESEILSGKLPNKRLDSPYIAALYDDVLRRALTLIEHLIPK
jgi:hypothetical protein